MRTIPGWSALAVALLFATPAIADDAADDARDEAFAQAVKDFGYAGGAAWQCGDDATKLKIERQALTSFNGLSRLFGADEAFFFSTAFGAGAVDRIDNANCPAFLKHLEDSAKEGGLQ